MTSDPAARPVLLVGSVPLGSAGEVFEAAGRHLGALAPRLPDGETGARLTWIGWQRERLLHKTGLELAETLVGDASAPQRIRRLRLAPGFDPETLDLSPVGYREMAAASYDAFKAARDTGVIAAGTRFQISIPTPLVLASGVYGPRRALLAAFERAMRRELQDIASALPAQDLAIQWDVCLETEMEESRRHPGRRRTVIGGVERPPAPSDAVTGPPPSFEETMDAVGRVCAMTPPEAELGLHLCYGDPDGRHIIEPEDASVMRDIANAVAARSSRPLQWIHMPVPIERDDDAFFAPLGDLRIGPETTIFLGLVHLADGLDGSRRRLAAAGRVMTDFGIASECGLGRRPPQTVPALLDLHRRTAQL